MDMGVPALRVISTRTSEDAPPRATSTIRPLRGAQPLLEESDAALVRILTGDRNGAALANHLTDATVDGDPQPEAEYVPLRGALRARSDSHSRASQKRGALEKLYRRHAEFAFRLAVRLQGNSQDIEDVVHDAFLKAHQRVESLNDPAAFRGWLGSIVVNEVRIRMRRGRLLRTFRLQTSEPVELDSLVSSEASPEVRAQLAQVYGLLRLMPTDERIAWTLRFVERHRLEDVAQLTGCSLATAKRRLSSAQRFINEHFVQDSVMSAPAARGATP